MSTVEGPNKYVCVCVCVCVCGVMLHNRGKKIKSVTDNVVSAQFMVQKSSVVEQAICVLFPQASKEEEQ